MFHLNYNEDYRLDSDDTVKGFSRLVSAKEFEQLSKQNDREHKRINLALWGSEGNSGVVRAVNDMALQQKILIGVLVFVQPLIFALIIKWLGV